ncbi:response regulator transcription factor [Paenibacillus pinihumi]|uniref:response regulator transcription factor n=1 Tax=Paenibacillus pinihumi TaxID=669462 RepID=UPI0004204981|nr:response regulator transcription factor [Paenibacillus pinihumi]
MQAHILLVEDDTEISEMVRRYLVKEGFTITAAYDGAEAAALFASGCYDLILLDMMLPKLNGMEFLKQVRETSVIPVLILSAKDGEADKALGLGFGADDYIAKPFSMIELTARIRAALRRATSYSRPEPPAAPSDIIRVHELEMKLSNFTVTRRGEAIKLTAKEFHILKLFVTSPGRVYTKAQIYQSVWSDAYYGDENVINVHMRRLREKIEDDPSVPRYILTLWGIGYKLGEFQS